MRRVALALAGLAAILAACAPAGPPPVVRTRLPDEEPTVRVGVAVNTTEIEVSAPSRFEIGEPGRSPAVKAAAGERWLFTADDDGRLVARGAGGRRIGPFQGPVRVRVQNGDQPVEIGGRPYRGGAIIRAAGPGRVTAVNVLALEEYLMGVVPLEIGPRPAAEIEAVKAQAVAARTYAISHLGGRESLGFDFYATVSDQVYGGRSSEHDVTSRAVRETRGEILTYDGAPILAYYHSTCGGRTAAIDEVWRSPRVPYLVSISDRVEGEDEVYYCEISNRFRWSERWSGQALRDVLTRTLGRRDRPIERIDEIRITGHTASGRAKALRIVADGETHVIEPPDSIRRVLQPELGRMLNSSLFVLDRSADDAEGVVVHGGGWGHGIGMCQMGAIGRARAGQDYRRILATYYRGTKIERLY